MTVVVKVVNILRLNTNNADKKNKNIIVNIRRYGVSSDTPYDKQEIVIELIKKISICSLLFFISRILVYRMKQDMIMKKYLISEIII